MSKIKEKIKQILPNMKKGIERFPLTIFCGIIVFLLSVYVLETSDTNNNRFIEEVLKFIFLMILCIPLTAALELVREKYFSGKNKWIIRALNAMITLAFIVFYRFYYLYEVGKELFFDNSEKLLATGIIFFLFFLLAPIIGKKDEEEKYFQSVIVDKAVTVLFSVVLFLGLTVVFLTVDGLSLIKLEGKIYVETWLFVVFVFAMIFFASKLKKVDENLEEYEIHKVFKFLIYFIIIPLITIYTGILYIYFGKMLITRSWPQGLVSHLILWYTIFSLFIMIMVTPMTKKDPVAKVFKKYFPFASIPLLALSIVSISKRISQYGVTELRYFIVLLGIWLIFCMVSSIFKARLSIILISLIAVVYISVFSPVNNRRITIMSQNKRLERILIKHGLLKDGKLVKNSGLNENQKYEITDVLNYILGIRDKKEGIENVQPFGKSDGKPYTNIDEFKKAVGIDHSWYEYGSGTDDYYAVFTINEKQQNDSYNVVEEVNGYEYLVSNITSYNFENDLPREFSGKYPVKISEKNISVYNGNIENGKEIIKIEISEILKTILDKPEIQQKINKPKEEIKDSVVPENVLEFTGENEKIKYRIKMTQISVRGNDDRKAEIMDYHYSFYYSIKK
jgi:putative membrane protein